MADIYGLYERAWTEIRGLVPIHYDDVCVNGEGGYFQLNGVEPPIIILCTNGGYERERVNRPSRRLADGGDATDERLLSELITLAHEYGHFMSNHSRTEPTEWLRYREAEDRRRLGGPIAEADRDLIVAEETLAWQIGRELLNKLGGVDDYWTEYERRAALGIASYAGYPVT